MRADGISARALAPCEPQNPPSVTQQHSTEQIFHSPTIFVQYDSENSLETSSEDLKTSNGNTIHEPNAEDKKQTRALSARFVSSPDKKFKNTIYDIDDVSSKSSMSTEEQHGSPQSSSSDCKTADPTLPNNVCIDNDVVVEVSSDKSVKRSPEDNNNARRDNSDTKNANDVPSKPSPVKGFRSYPGFTNTNCPVLRPDDIIYDEFDESSVSNSYKSIYFDNKSDRSEDEANISGATPKALGVREDVEGQCESPGLNGSSRSSSVLREDLETDNRTKVSQNIRKRYRRTFANPNEYTDFFNCPVESRPNLPTDADNMSYTSSASIFNSFCGNISPSRYIQNGSSRESLAHCSRRGYPSRSYNSKSVSNTTLENEHNNSFNSHARDAPSYETLQKCISKNRLPYDVHSTIDRLPLDNNSSRASAQSSERTTPLPEFSPRYSVGPLENFSKSYYAIAAARSEALSSVPKSQSCYDYRLPERPRRAAVQHRDADEALSCLLWQPYECRGGEDGASVGESGPCPSPPHSRTAARYGELSRAVDMRLTVPAPAHGRATDAHPASVVVSLHQPTPESNVLQQTISHTTASAANVVHASVIHSASVEGSIQDAVSNNNNGCRLSVVGSDGGRRSHDVGVVSVNGEVVSGCISVPALRTWGSQTEEPGSAAAVSAAVTRIAGPPQLPPPYSTLPHAYSLHAQPQPLPPPPLQQHAYPFQPVSLRRCQYGEDSERPKTCCGAGGARALSLRWFIVLVALTGVCCVLVGTVLGAVRAQGRAHLTVLLLMIGVGLVLVIVSGVAWRAAGRRRGRAARAAANGAASGAGPTRRVPSACARAHHPYAAMLYPEFHCRAPPPSYQVSMQDYRLRLLHLDRGVSPPPITCPPPAYRPRPRGAASGNPQYMGGRGARGRRRPEPRTPAPQLSSVVIQNIALEPYDEIKYDDEPELGPPIGSDSKEEEVHLENKEGNLVTIVQTGEDTSPVIVTVSGSMPEERTQSQTHTSEIDILAHL